VRHALIAIFVAACAGSQAGPGDGEPAPAAAESRKIRIEPPPGWLIEPNADHVTVASAATSPAVIALTTLPLAATMARIQQEANALAEAVNVTVPGSIRLRQLAERAQKAGGRKLALWELPDAARNGEPGAVIVFAGKLTDADLVVGIGFAATDDLATSDAILAALATISPPR
jgi:hypothetical protein